MLNTINFPQGTTGTTYSSTTPLWNLAQDLCRFANLSANTLGNINGLNGFNPLGSGIYGQNTVGSPLNTLGTSPFGYGVSPLQSTVQDVASLCGLNSGLNQSAFGNPFLGNFGSSPSVLNSTLHAGVQAGIAYAFNALASQWGCAGVQNPFVQGLNSAFSGVSPTNYGTSTTSLNCIDNDHEFIVECWAPGAESKNTSVTVVGSEIRIRAHAAGVMHTHTHGTSSGFISVPLPGVVDVSAIKATVKDGIVKIVLPKTKAVTDTIRQIKVA
ncbi:Hsp20/alpha crystallin family protein [Candidatus Bealeia paramacronuclearis]|uniref:Hsp20/alpha crystallin family protein n=1 Tax=Candidatus Bealeia paramacronuclearis TaxID=1921001 RepID=A0ABZ2C4S6_9PROT|nr:Hsp20/alpha crystallin family protein [Candidatus Bealeia paramacronuclearis]